MRDIQSKIHAREELAKIIALLRRSEKKIGVTNGVFDLLHAGHVIYLKQAKKKCDVLIVSINTDSSAKEYKGIDRPINSQEDRAIVLAALESVDYVTFHNERRMRDTLKVLKPHYYIKAGDYQLRELTSRDVLAKWGGKVIIIPPLKGRSTTKTIQKIINAHENTTVSLKSSQQKESRAVILDRDGVINEEVEYLHEPEKFKFLTNVLNGLKKMQSMGFKIVIATTQAGIGLGYFTKEDFFKVNKAMLKDFKENGIVISKIYFCPHGVDENCSCRKPKIGLIERAKEDLFLDLSQSWAIGDKTADIEAGKKAGCRTILIKTGHKGKDKEFEVRPDFTAEDLKEAAAIIKNYS